MISNEQIAEIFDKMASLIEFHWESDPADPFRIRAYRRAAQIIRNYPHNIYQLRQSWQLRPIPWLGEKTRVKLKEYLQTGTIQKYEKLKRWVPESVLELMDIPWVWPKLAKLLYEELWIDSVEKLQKVIEENPEKILSLPRMWLQKLNQIKKWLELYQYTQKRTPLWIVWFFIQDLKEQISNFEEVKKVEVAWSTRRMKETVWDIDMLCVSDNPIQTMDKFVSLDNIDTVLAKWITKTSVFLKQPHIQVDLRIVPEQDWWAALQYFTWSRQHNIHLRTIAKEKWFKISEYWIFKIKEVWRGSWAQKSEEIQEVRVGGEKEEDIYNALWMDWIPPEMREDQWEIELAIEHKLPKLIEYWSLKGDLHTHSTWSDGLNSIKEMVEAAISLGYEYIAITDHSQSLAVANWLDPKRWAERLKEIEDLRKFYKDKIQILVWTECDILADWTLDYPDEILAQCDIVVASIHMWYKWDMTARYLKAMENPYVTIIWHPTDRLLGERDQLQVNWDIVFQKAIEKNIAMEINCQPLRLDLPDVLIRKFNQMWWYFSIDTDAHSVKNLVNYSVFGIWQARRWWVSSDRVINTWPWKKLKKWLDERIG